MEKGLDSNIIKKETIILSKGTIKEQIITWKSNRKRIEELIIDIKKQIKRAEINLEGLNGLELRIELCNQEINYRKLHSLILYIESKLKKICSDLDNISDDEIELIIKDMNLLNLNKGEYR